MLKKKSNQARKIQSVGSGEVPHLGMSKEVLNEKVIFESKPGENEKVYLTGSWDELSKQREQSMRTS